MEAQQASKGNAYYHPATASGATGDSAMLTRNNAADKIMNKRRGSDHAPPPPLKTTRGANPVAGSPYMPGRDTMTGGSTRRIPPASTRNGARFQEEELRRRFSAEAGPSRGMASTVAVKQSRRPLQAHATADAADDDEVVYRGQTPSTKRGRPSSSPDKSRNADLRPIHFASTNPGSHRERSVEQVDTPSRPVTRSSGPSALLAAIQGGHEAGRARRTSRASGSKSKSPEKPSEPGRVSHTGTVTTSVPDPIMEFSDDEPQWLEKPGQRSSRRLEVPRTVGSAQRSSRQSLSPKKRDDEEHISDNDVARQSRSTKRQRGLIPSSNLPQRLAIARAFCDPQTNSERRPLPRNLRVEEIEARGESITLRNLESRGVDIPVECLKAITACVHDKCPCLTLLFHLRAGDLTVRRSLAESLASSKFEGRLHAEELHRFSLHFRFFDGVSVALQQVIRQLSSASRVAEKHIMEHTCQFLDQQSQTVAQTTAEIPPTRQHSKVERHAEPEGAVGDEQPRKQARPSRGKVEKTVVVERKGNGKGKQKANADQPTLWFPPSSDADRSKTANTRRSTRISDQQPTKYADGPIDVDPEEAKPARSPVPPAPIDKDTVLFPYPLHGRSMLAITKGDRWRVESGEFLNDTVLEWALKHVLAQTAEARPDWDIHLFNSFFFNKIGDKGKRRQEDADGRWPAYDNVRKWTKSTDIFSKRFVIVPINEEFHWYLAVVYNPAGILDPQTDTSGDNAAAAAAAAEDVPDLVVNQPVATGVAFPDDHQESEDVMDVDNFLNEHFVGDTPAVEGGTTSAPSSPDPLDCITVSTSRARSSIGESEVQNDAHVLQGMEGLKIEPDSTKPSVSPAVGQPIDDAVLSGIRTSEEPPPKAEVAKIEKKEKAKDIPYRILDDNRTWVFTFDSLGAAHKGVAHTLYRWLKHEAKDKKGLDIALGPENLRYVHAQVPLQANFSDCGLYLVHYVKQLLSHPESVLRFLETKMPSARSEARKAYDQEVQAIWGISRDHNLRQEWVAIIDSLHSEHERIEAERVSKEKSTSKEGTSSSPEKQEEPLPQAASQNDFEEMPPPSANLDQEPPVPPVEAAAPATIDPDPSAVHASDQSEPVDSAIAPDTSHSSAPPAAEPSVPALPPDECDPAADTQAVSEANGDLDPFADTAKPGEARTSDADEAVEKLDSQIGDPEEEGKVTPVSGSVNADADTTPIATKSDAPDHAGQPDDTALQHDATDLEALVHAMGSASTPRSGSLLDTLPTGESVPNGSPRPAVLQESPILQAPADLTRYKATEGPEEDLELYSEFPSFTPDKGHELPAASTTTPQSTPMPTIFRSPPVVPSPFLSEQHARGGPMNPPSSPRHSEEAIPSFTHRKSASPVDHSRPLTAMTAASSSSTSSTRNRPPVFDLHPRPLREAFRHAPSLSPTDSTAGVRMLRDPSRSMVRPATLTSVQNVQHDLPGQPTSPAAHVASHQVHHEPPKVDPPTALSGPRGSKPPWQLQGQSQSKQSDHARPSDAFAKAAMPRSAEKLAHMLRVIHQDSASGPSDHDHGRRRSSPVSISGDSDDTSLLSEPDVEMEAEDDVATGTEMTSEGQIARSDDDLTSVAHDPSARSSRSPEIASRSDLDSDSNEDVQPARGKRRNQHSDEPVNPDHATDVDELVHSDFSDDAHETTDDSDKENTRGGLPEKENRPPPRGVKRPAPIPRSAVPFSSQESIPFTSPVPCPSDSENEEKQDKSSPALSVASLAPLPSTNRRGPKKYKRRRISLNPGAGGSGQTTLSIGDGPVTPERSTRSTPRPSAAGSKRKSDSPVILRPEQPTKRPRASATGFKPPASNSIIEVSSSDSEESPSPEKRAAKKSEKARRT